MADAEAVRHVTYEAFQDMPFADGDEYGLVDALRDFDALTISLVAELDGAVIGHVAISPANAADGSAGWYALGPVLVLPVFQRAGIGSALIWEAMRRLESLAARGCILTGNPSYYTRFGFQLAPALAPEREPAEYFMVKVMGESLPPGRFGFHEAFYGPA